MNIRGVLDVWYWDVIKRSFGSCGLEQWGKGIASTEAMKSHQIAVCEVWKPNEHLQFFENVIKKNVEGGGSYSGMMLP